jgi:hypothetical protein
MRQLKRISSMEQSFSWETTRPSDNKEFLAFNGTQAGHGSREVACFLFARSEAVTVGSNPTQGMDV